MSKLLNSFISIALIVIFSACGGGGGSDSKNIPKSPLGTNTVLSDLSFSEGNISPSFSPSTHTYTATVGNWVQTVTISARTADPKATLSADGINIVTGEPSAPISLPIGEKEISLLVTSEDGLHTESYSLRITRVEAAENNADLHSLVLSVGSLSPIFDSNTLSYTTNVSFNTASIKLTAIPVNAYAAITINGQTVSNGVASDPITLSEGNTTIDVLVLSYDGSTLKTYSVSVNKQSVSDIEQQAYIKKNFQIEDFDFFGGAISIDGNRLAVGTHNDYKDGTLTGSVYIYVKNNGSWTFESYVKSPNPEINDHFGTSVSLQGDLLVVGAPEEDSNATGIDGDMTNNSATDSGAVYVFQRSGTNWVHQSYIKASNSQSLDGFGISVDLDGDVLAVGAYNESSDANTVNGDQSDNSATAAGAVYVFTRNNTSWIQNAYIKASNSDTGDQFGVNLDLDGNTLVVEATGEDSNASSINGDQNDNSAYASGAVYVYVRSNNTWNQQAYIKSSNSESGDLFGLSVSLDGDWLAVGARGESSNATGIDGDATDNSMNDSGAVYIFERNINAWTQQAYIKASNTQLGDRFGESVVLKNGLLVVSATYEDSNATGVNGNQIDNTSTNSGAVYLFQKSVNGWSQNYYIKASNTDAGDNFGSQLGFDESTIVVSATHEQSSVTGVNGNQGNNTIDSAGAVYVFKVN